jgi:hypothetical protein
MSDGPELLSRCALIRQNAHEIIILVHVASLEILESYQRKHVRLGSDGGATDSTQKIMK